MDNEFIHFNFKTEKWSIGQNMPHPDQTSAYQTPKNASILNFLEEHHCNNSHVVITGGVSVSGELLQNVTTLEFSEDQEQQQSLNPRASKFDFQLSVGRMMHQSAIVKGEKGRYHLVLMGGKVGKNESTA
mmetsp:Transcript_30888/g.47272  ORF Transcript_30888/g.47272 Transcript_30888/m.47272 type:complete len:130 (-) Transcript_30888:720-1109(-)